MTTQTIAVSVEATPKKAFATAVDWPGWSRSGKTEELALAALQDYAPRYAVVAEEAEVPFDPGDYEIVERTEGAGGTDFGVPSSITDLDRRPVDAAEAERQARLVRRPGPSSPASPLVRPPSCARAHAEAAGIATRWSVTSPESDGYYAREIGITGRRPDPTDSQAIEATRAEMLDILRRPSDGSALAGRTWTARYAARRIAWHALDHAWEMEDRSDPA